MLPNDRLLSRDHFLSLFSGVGWTDDKEDATTDRDDLRHQRGRLLVIADTLCPVDFGKHPEASHYGSGHLARHPTAEATDSQFQSSQARKKNHGSKEVKGKAENWARGKIKSCKEPRKETVGICPWRSSSELLHFQGPRFQTTHLYHRPLLRAQGPKTQMLEDAACSGFSLLPPSS